MAKAEYIRPDIWAKTGGRCWYCGCDLDAINWSIDHFLPRVRGGSDLASNLVPACRACNAANGDEPSLDRLREYLIEVVLKKRRPVRVKAIAKPVPSAGTGGQTNQNLPRVGGAKLLKKDYRVVDLRGVQPPFFSIAFYFEEQGLKP